MCSNTQFIAASTPEEGGREGEREGEREREGGRAREREGGREGGREAGREGGREGREGGREGEGGMKVERGKGEGGEDSMMGRREGEWREEECSTSQMVGYMYMCTMILQQQLITHIHNMPHLSLVVERASYTHKLSHLHYITYI